MESTRIFTSHEGGNRDPGDLGAATVKRFSKAPVVIFGVKCHYCQHSYPPGEVTEFLNGVNICQKCTEWHNQALLILAGKPPESCQVCLRSFSAIANCIPGDYISLRLVPKDGVYQVLCARCCEPYKRKVKHLYQGTQHAWEQKL